MAQKPYEYQPFPAVRYHREGQTRIVHTQEAHDALIETGDWADSPIAFDAAFDAAPEQPAPETPAPKAGAKKRSSKPEVPVE